MLGSLRHVGLDCDRLRRGRSLDLGRRGLGVGCGWLRLALCGGVVGVVAVISRGKGEGRRGGRSREAAEPSLKETFSLYNTGTSQ